MRNSAEFLRNYRFYWRRKPCMLGPMQPIIRHTVTITITESWTITWQDGQATSWQATHEVAWPAMNEPDEWLAPLTTDEESDDDTLDPDATDQDTEDE